MIIQPEPVEVSAADLLDATEKLDAFFQHLIATFGGDGMKRAGWLLTFRLPSADRSGGRCYYAEKMVDLNAFSLAQTVAKGEGLDWWRGLVIHEFCHAWGFHNFSPAQNHTLPFHAVVSLLLAVHGLAWDKTLYNLQDDQGGRYNYTPAVLFRGCRFLARGVKCRDTLRAALLKLLAHFDTRPVHKWQQRVSQARIKENAWRKVCFETLEAVEFWKGAAQISFAACALTVLAAWILRG
jgi:hypothetical protein